MAIDFCSEISSAGISPRISFSHDLKNAEIEEDPSEDRPRRRSELCLVDSSSDFVFCITNNGLSQELSSADELFSDGKIVPLEIKKLTFPNASSSSSSYSDETHRVSDSVVPPRSDSPSTERTEKKRLVEFLNEEEKPPSRSFWQFKRSSSLNYEGKSLIRSLHFLSRSNSTGSALSNPKQTETPKETQKQRLQKQSSVSSRRQSLSSSSSSSSATSFSSSSTFHFYSSSQNHSLKKKCGYSGNGVRISPVLNLPQAYIPKAYVGFFGFGSLFCNGKIKKKNK